MPHMMGCAHINTKYLNIYIEIYTHAKKNVTETENAESKSEKERKR